MVTAHRDIGDGDIVIADASDRRLFAHENVFALICLPRFDDEFTAEWIVIHRAHVDLGFLVFFVELVVHFGDHDGFFAQVFDGFVFVL